MKKRSTTKSDQGIAGLVDPGQQAGNDAIDGNRDIGAESIARAEVMQRARERAHMLRRAARVGVEHDFGKDKAESVTGGLDGVEKVVLVKVVVHGGILGGVDVSVSVGGQA